MSTAKGAVNQRAHEIAKDLIELSLEIGSFHDAAPWYTLLMASELAVSMPAGMRIADMTAGRLAQEMRRIHTKALQQWRAEREFDQRVVADE